jgi:hypothetical protein
VAQAGWLGYSGRVYPLEHVPGLAAEPGGHRPLYAAGECDQTPHRAVVALLQLVDMTNPTPPTRLTERGPMFDPVQEGLALAQVGWLDLETGDVFPLSRSGDHRHHQPLYVSLGVLVPDALRAQ